MPATAPPLPPTAATQLRLLGERIQAQRKSLSISANATAQAAGMSRVTLHRIERGEPSVTIGAYINTLAALGLELQAHAAQTGVHTAQATQGAPAIRIADHPPLRALAWQLPDNAELSEQEAVALLERNWRHLDFAQMPETERQWIDNMLTQHCKGHLLV